MTSLTRLLRDRIRRDGPISVEAYMSMALGHPAYGYYVTRNPLGRAGDFVTAPEVSQIFGEMLGLWCVDLWQRAGSPALVQLIELGPGRGTLMADALRAAAVIPTFLDAIQIHLVETSPVLVDQQKAALKGIAVTWHKSLDTVPGGTALIIANEFFDALPIQQFVRAAEGWARRCVGLSADNRFEFVGGRKMHGDDLPRGMPAGTVCERCPTGAAVMSQLTARLSNAGGALLLTDYGYYPSGVGETLQAVRRHMPVDPLAVPGEADLTAHVDFAALADVARQGGAKVYGPVSQYDFLRRLGVAARAAALCRNTDPAKRREILDGLQRLMDPAQMGTLFKVLCVTHPDWPAPDGVR